VVSRAWAAYPHAELGAFAEGLDLAGEALQAAEATRNPVHLASACVALGHLHLRSGDLRRAIEFGERGLAIRQAGDLPQWFSMLTRVLGPALVMRGRIEEGLELLEQGHRIYGERRIQAHRAFDLLELGEASLRAGRLSDAVACADQALHVSRQRGERGFEAHTLRLLAEIACRHDDADRRVAQGHYAQALALACDLGMRPLVAHCHLGLGKLHPDPETRAGARGHLRAAAAMYGELGMRFWLEHAEEALKALG
jgi:tetratricopeptide (TPR) repeat protein